jgi:hypothetical protein
LTHYAAFRHAAEPITVSALELRTDRALGDVISAAVDYLDKLLRSQKVG